MLLNILLGVIIVVCVGLVIVILLQRSEGGALGMSGGGPGNFMTARGTGDFLTQATQILAGVFFALCLVMTLVSGHNRAQSSIEKLKLQINPNATQTAPVPSAPPAGGLAPATPVPAQQAPAPSSAPAGPLNPFGSSAVVTPAKKPAQ